MAKECPAEILKKFEEHGCKQRVKISKVSLSLVEAEWVKGEYAIFIGNYPSGKANRAQVMERLEKAAAERFPNAVPKNVAEALYPAFDPDNKGEVDFIAAAKVKNLTLAHRSSQKNIVGPTTVQTSQYHNL